MTVANLHAHGSADVIQLYLTKATATRTSLRELAGFERVELAAGETRGLTFELGPRQLECVLEDGRRQFLPGTLTLFAGTCQPDARSRELGGSWVESQAKLT